MTELTDLLVMILALDISFMAKVCPPFFLSILHT
jgi:hypothetical protein